MILGLAVRRDLAPFWEERGYYNMTWKARQVTARLPHFLTLWGCFFFVGSDVLVVIVYLCSYIEQQIQFKHLNRKTMRRLSLFVPLALAACAADNISPDLADGAAADTAAPSVRVVDGTLHFATSEAYFDFGREMVNRDPDERRRWEASHGFTSMLSYAEDVMDDYELRLGEALGRPDIFSVAADSAVDLEVPLTLAVLADKEGYFYIGDAICKVGNSGMARVDGGDKAQAEAALRSGAAPGVSSGGGVAFREKSLGSAKCIDRFSASAQSGRLKVDYSINTLFLYDGKSPVREARIVIEQRSKNFKRKFWRWRQHHDFNGFKSVVVTVQHSSIGVFGNYGNNTVEFYVPDYGGGETVSHYASGYFTVNPPPGYVHIGDQPCFLKMRGVVFGPGNVSIDLEERFGKI